MPATYEPIATATGTGSSGVITFTSIPSTYTDLVLVANGTTSANSGWGLQFNSDTTATYSTTYVEGSGTAASSERTSATATICRIAWNSLWNSTVPSTNIVSIQNYTNTTTYKTVLFKNNSSTYVEAGVGLWRATPAAINRIDVTTATAGAANFTTAATFTLYGIKAA